MSKYKQVAQELGFIDHPNENTTLNNLLKIPKRDNKENTPHTTNPTENADQQADLLFLPNDNGFKYALVVVDIATRKTDAEPMKKKTPEATLNAILKIYKRKVLKPPKLLEFDSGTEVKGEFAEYFRQHNIRILQKEPGRHRQQSVVETRNGLISKLLQKRMLAQEINTDETSREWVSFLPKVIKAINTHYTQEPQQVLGTEPVRCSGTSCKLLPIGTNVRVQLDNPIDYTSEKRLHGKFRIGDIRWTKQPQPITQLFLRPDQPPMYQVNHNDNVAYTKNQLQVVKPDEVKPSAKLQHKYTIDKLIGKKKIKGLVYYHVLWKSGERTWEPRKELIKDVPEIVANYDS